MSNTASLSIVQLKKAIVIREKIDALKEELYHILRAGILPVEPIAAQGGKKQMSVSTRRFIAASQKAHWTRNKATTAQIVKSKPRRKISAETKVKMAAAAKRRWAIARATEK